MSQENVEVVRKLYESRGSEFYELLDPHVVWINLASAPRRGHTSVTKGFVNGPMAFELLSETGK
jgi:hypothetical protein